MSYPRLVQGVLDRHCVRCHDGGDSAASVPPALTGQAADRFTISYESLQPYVRWYEWGDKSITQTVTRPGHCGADESPLLGILGDQNHRPHVELPEEDLRRIYLWLDANAPFYGTYQQQARSRQLAGQVVLPPSCQ